MLDLAQCSEDALGVNFLKETVNILWRFRRFPVLKKVLLGMHVDHVVGKNLHESVRSSVVAYEWHVVTRIKMVGFLA